MRANLKATLFCQNRHSVFIWITLVIRKMSIFIGMGILFTACIFSTSGYSQNDPLSLLDYGKVSLQTIESEFYRKSLISEPIEYDNTYYKYYIENGDSKIPVELYFNSDGYGTEELRDLELNLNGDSVFYDKPLFRRGDGPRAKAEIDRIIQIYHNWYGEPDNISYPMVSEAVKEIRILLGRNEKGETKTLEWYEPHYKISLFVPASTRISSEDTSIFYKGATIIYSSLDYEEKLKSLKENILKKLAPNDIVTIGVREPRWELNQESANHSNSVWDFKLDIVDIMRQAPEEERSIKAIRFDIIFTDLFGEEISRLEDVTYELTTKLDAGRSFIFSRLQEYIYTYNMNSDYALPVEKARRYAANNTLEVSTKTKAIVFANNEILK